MAWRAIANSPRSTSIFWNSTTLVRIRLYLRARTNPVGASSSRWRRATLVHCQDCDVHPEYETHGSDRRIWQIITCEAREGSSITGREGCRPAQFT